MVKDSFVNLHSHSMHSHMDAIVRIKDLFARALELGQDTVVLTDHGVMSGIFEAYNEYKKYKSQGIDINFIPGNEIYFVEDLEDRKSKRRHLVLLAMNEEGYKNLLRITAEGFAHAVNAVGKQFPRVDEAILKKYNKGIIASSACGGSLIAARIFKGDREQAIKAAQLFHSIFGDRFYIELQPHDLKSGSFDQQFLNDQLKTIAEELKIEMIATCDSHYLTPKHEKYHDMVLAIGAKKPLDDISRHRYATVKHCLVCGGAKTYPEGSPDLCYACMGQGIASITPCPEFYLKTGEQIVASFAKKYGTPFAKNLVANTRIIADRCGKPDYMEPKGLHLPTFPWEEEPNANEFKSWLNDRPKMTSIPKDAAYLRFIVWGAFNEYCKSFNLKKKTIYWKRVVSELEILESRNFSSYMLIVADFINWARTNGIRIGPGRGSGAGSLVGFLQKIHAVDSIEFDLLFERFQSRLRPDPPDYDVDVAPSGRERVINYCREKYGSDHLALISNVLKLTPKLVIKDVSRSLQLGGDRSSAFKIANDITATIPDTFKNSDGKVIKIDTMERALATSKPLQGFVQQYPDVLDYANYLIGLPRSFATHAAGVIISDIPLNEYIPLRRDKEGVIIAQYDKHVCEAHGLVKMDFLGLDTLDTIQETWTMAQDLGITALPLPESMPMNDERVFKLIQSGHVAGVFQLAGSLSALCKSLKPKNIYDLALINALGRPNCSPAERKSFINRKFGREKIVYPHKLLAEILEPTLGITIFDEDLLRIAHHVAGWDLSKADGLRKLTKEKTSGSGRAEVLEHDFIRDAMGHSSITKEEAKLIWDDVVIPFTLYGFCLSHAVVYSMISYHTAFYKVHATGPFLCASLNTQTRSNKKDKAEQIDILKRECKKFKISIIACDINISKQYYTMKDTKTIVTGLGAIKGIGNKALNAIIQHQPYSSFEDFLFRTPSSTVSKTIIIALAKAGAFDSFGITRKYAVENYANIRKAILKHIKKLDDSYYENGHRDKPLSHVLENFEFKDRYLASEDDWDLRNKLLFEKEVLGEFVSGSIDILYPNFFKGGIYATPYSRLERLPDGANFQSEGLITNITEIAIKKVGRNQGKIMARIILESAVGDAVDVTIWPGDYSKYKKYLKVDIPIRGLFKVNEYNERKTLILANLEAVYKESTNEV